MLLFKELRNVLNRLIIFRLAKVKKMRKEVKPAVKCKCCKQVIDYPVVQNFCDFCGKLLPEKLYPLEITIFKTVESSDTERLDFDTWQCVKGYLTKNQKKLLRCHLVNLPMPVFRGNSEREQHCDTGANFLKVFLLNGNKESGNGGKTNESKN